MTRKNLYTSLSMGFGMSLGTLLYDLVRHRDEVAENFPYKYLFMFVFIFVIYLAVNAAKAKQTKLKAD